MKSEWTRKRLGKSEARDTVEEFWNEAVLESCLARVGAIRVEDFLDAFRQYLDAEGALYVFPHARRALEASLAALPRERSDVWVSSFNCPVVGDAVIAAGFSVRTFDFADRTGRFDWPALAAQLDDQLAAIVVPHFFGVPTDFRPILEPAKALGIYVIEDCSHTLGGRIGNKPAGTWGDAAIFSFNYDKPISLGGGGILHVRTGEPFTHRFASVDVAKESKELAAFLRYIERRRAEIGNAKGSLWQRGTRKLCQKMMPGLTANTFPVSGIGPLRAALGLWQLQRYDTVMQIRNENAAKLVRHTGSGWTVPPCVLPAWLKQKIVPADPRNVRRISQRLNTQGLRSGLFNWPYTLENHLGLPANAPNAEYLALHALDVPIHQGVEFDDLDKMRALLTEAGA